jgi:hypothetical protein
MVQIQISITQQQTTIIGWPHFDSDIPRRRKTQKLGTRRFDLIPISSPLEDSF